MAITTMDLVPRTTTTQRKRLVAHLAADGINSATEIHAILREQGVVNARSGKAYSLSTIRNDVSALDKVPVREIIGRTTDTSPLWRWRSFKSVDATQTDYQYWDKLRRGKAAGFAFGGLFCMPLTQIIASTVWGDGASAQLAPSVEGNQANIDYTNDLLARFMARMHRTFFEMTVDLYGLGDQYMAANPDSSISRISPELVEIEPGELDYRETKSIKVTSQLDKYKIEDEYRTDGRTVTITGSVADETRIPRTQPTGTKNTAEFSNLIGRLPIVHFPNDRGTNELYGRPIYEALFRLFSRYDDLIEKALDGAELMGNPMPTFEGMEDIDETIDANASADDGAEYTSEDGNAETRRLINWDRLGALFIGKGGSFSFKSPGTGFTTDIRNMLKSLFLLMLDFTRVPEAVWGGAINSSRASAEAQMPPFFQYIQSRRIALEGEGGDDALAGEASGGLYELLDVWLRTRALTDPRIVVGATEIKWPELDKAAWDSLLQWVSYMHDKGLLSGEEVVRQFGKVEDPAAAIEDADEWGDKVREREMEAQEAFTRQLGQAEQDATQPDQQEPAQAQVTNAPENGAQRATDAESTPLQIAV